MGTREYDVVLYGAAGVTGRQTVAYFSKRGAPGIRWAIAGRNRGKLEAVRSAVGGPARAVDILVADSRDQVSVDAIVSRTRVVLNTAGPFALYGTPVVDACVRFGTHQVRVRGRDGARPRPGCLTRRLSPWRGLTPATGLGHVLADRLRRAGVTIDIGQPMSNAAIEGDAAVAVLSRRDGQLDVSLVTCAGG